jgi:hypothetical protein
MVPSTGGMVVGCELLQPTTCPQPTPTRGRVSACCGFDGSRRWRQISRVGRCWLAARVAWPSTQEQLASTKNVDAWTR